MSSLRKQLAEARTAAALAQARSLVSSASTIGPHKAQMLVARLDNIDAKAMQVGIVSVISLAYDMFLRGVVKIAWFFCSESSLACLREGVCPHCQHLTAQILHLPSCGVFINVV